MKKYLLIVVCSIVVTLSVILAVSCETGAGSQVPSNVTVTIPPGL
jgi:hypothetical protein